MKTGKPRLWRGKKSAQADTAELVEAGDQETWNDRGQAERDRQRRRRRKRTVKEAAGAGRGDQRDSLNWEALCSVPALGSPAEDPSQEPGLQGSGRSRIGRRPGVGRGRRARTLGSGHVTGHPEPPGAPSLHFRPRPSGPAQVAHATPPPGPLLSSPGLGSGA
ncbi:hypothetical protein VULLAG_LOCUS10239 [Vulpes lagopus]